MLAGVQGFANFGSIGEENGTVFTKTFVFLILLVFGIVVLCFYVP